MDSEMFYKDVEKRANEMFNDWYSTWPGMQDKHFEMSVDREKNAFGGGSYVENGVLKMVIFSGTIDNYLSVINDVMNFRSSIRIHNIHRDNENPIDMMSAEGIIYEDGVPKVFDSKVIDKHITELIMTFINRFIICHEFGHLFSGHYEQFKKVIKMNFIPMQMTGDEWSRVPEDKKLDINTMEWDADSFAATDSMRELLFLWENYDTQVQYKDCISRKGLFFWWGFSVALIFHWISEMDCYRLYDNEILYTPRDRMINTLNVALDCINNLFDNNTPESTRKEMSSNIVRGACEAEELYSKYKKRDSIWIKEDTDMSDSGLSIIEENWKKLKEVLKKDAFINLDQ